MPTLIEKLEAELETLRHTDLPSAVYAMQTAISIARNHSDWIKIEDGCVMPDAGQMVEIYDVKTERFDFGYYWQHANGFVNRMLKPTTPTHYKIPSPPTN